MSLTADRALPGAWTREGSEVAAALGTDPVDGLTADEAAARLLRYGRNELIERGRKPPWRLLLEQFTNAMIIVLLAAAVVTALLGDLKDTVVILAIVVLNGIVGFVQEYRAEQALDALKRMASPTARVVRGGETLLVPAPEVVPGDLVRLDAGDIVTADLRLLEARALRINEAALTGESEPAEKTTEPLPGVPEGVLADQRNVAFNGTAVVYGRGAGVVLTTGMSTSLGRVAELLQEHAGGQTPLQKRLSTLGKALALLALVVCSIVFAAGVARGESPEEMFLVAVSLAVAAIPEGLPAVVTVALALGARRMARRNALVRKLPAVETLGSVTVICSDKTGTLTENRMLVERAWTPAGAFVIGGDGYAPDGAIEPDGPVADEAAADLALDRLARIAAACNDATLRAPAKAGGEWSITGDPTEGALLAFAGKLGIFASDLLAEHPRVEELTFDAARRRMTTLHAFEDRVRVASKGALEALAPLLDPDDAPLLPAAETAALRYAADGYRVLALAYRDIEAIPADLEHAESSLRLAGIVAMADPPRAASTASIAACRAAGVTPVMITGDHPLTGTAIARRIGILGPGGETLTGVELDALDDATFADRVDRVAVYARMNPEQKLRIVEAWRGRGAVVAMTGDGVNDAPALRLADIGVAMGITGTEVSKEAADMVLADDDFSTIVDAVEEGRRIYDNIRRFVRYLLTTNSAEVWVMFLAPFLGLPIPLLAVQILWINLVTDGLPALALGVEPVEPDAMRRPPRPSGESILGAGLWRQALWVGLLMAAVVLGVQALAIEAGWQWQTMVFTTLALLQLGNAMAVRSERVSVFSLGFGTNRPLALAVGGTLLVQLALVYVPALQPIFVTEALGAQELAIVLVASTAAFVAVELEKVVVRRRLAAAQSPTPTG
ncbi:MAG: cation-translocating P-type ATPase [Chloroflexi bacterium]|nr:cation-translocating P-type ATPase [Chloroflexota bacterium]